MTPRDFFALSYLETRVADAPPPVLFHTTRSIDLAVKILTEGVIRGRPTVSTSENPAFTTPGPVTFIMDSRCVLELGYHLVPCVWAGTELQEAEWVVGSSDAKQLGYSTGGCVLKSKTVEIPTSCFIAVGHTPLWAQRRRGRIQKLKAAAGSIPVEQYDWEQWWERLLQYYSAEL